MMTQPRSSRALRVVRHLPSVLVAVPERVVLNYAFIAIGLGSFAPQAGSALERWWPWVLYGWCLAMAVGGGSVLYGMFRNETSIERLGYLLVAPAALLYGVSVLFTRGLSGVPVFLIFLGIAIAKVIRMIISSAERDLTLEVGWRLDHSPAEDDGDEE